MKRLRYTWTYGMGPLQRAWVQLCTAGTAATLIFDIATGTRIL